MKDLTKLAGRPTFWIGLAVLGMLIGLAFGVFLIPDPQSPIGPGSGSEGAARPRPRLPTPGSQRTFGGDSAARDQRRDVVLRSQPALVRLTSFGPEGEEVATGAGFFLTPTQVATSRHLVAHAHRTEAMTHGGLRVDVEDVVATNVGCDLALVTLPETDEPFQPLALAAQPPSEGDPVIVLGPRPDEDARITRDGVVFGVRDLRGFGTILEIGAHVSRSWSGSPIIDRRGGVVGITMAHGMENQDLQFAIPASTIRSLRAGTSGAVIGPPIGGAAKTATEAHDLHGVCAYLAGDLVRAAAEFDKAIQKNALDGLAWAYLGRCQKDLGRTAEAAASLEQASRLEPDDPSILLDLAIIHRGCGRIDEALGALDQAVRLAPDDVATRFVAGTEYRTLGAYARAAECLEQAWQLEPSLHAAREKAALCYCTVGLQRFKEEDVVRALGAFSSSVALNSENPNVLYNAGVCQVRLKQWAAAIDLLQRAATLAPGSAKIHVALGVAHARIGDRGSAEQVLATLRRIDRASAYKLAGELAAGRRKAPARLALESAED